MTERRSKFLVTGAAGFIGFHFCLRLLSENHFVVGVDNLNDYYEIKLKKDRLSILENYGHFRFHYLDITDKETISLIIKEKPDYLIHLAAQAGVRHSLENPHVYVSSNVEGFLNILEGCRNQPIKHLIFASSSSVYGANANTPFSVHRGTDHPVSLYGATKKANELMAHVYATLFNTPSTGLRFFTVYGPWGRPDMAYFSFAKAIVEEKTIDVYNFGNMKRDFTFIDDIVEAMYRLVFQPPVPDPAWSPMDPDPATSNAPYRIYNIGSSKPVDLMEFIERLEEALGKKAKKNFLPLQLGEIKATHADVEDLYRTINFRPSTPLEEGIKKFADWFKDYYNVQ
ncbi:MAG: NAD-dependent epimerase [Syntrophales bacterium]|nr:NAD-dependent epimerase [Syntrophales bacterium]